MPALVDFFESPIFAGLLHFRNHICFSPVNRFYHGVGGGVLSQESRRAERNLFFLPDSIFRCDQIRC